jgi:hypothetical protein
LWDDIPSPKSLLPDFTGGEPMVKALQIAPLGFPFDKIGAFYIDKSALPCGSCS